MGETSERDAIRGVVLAAVGKHASEPFVSNLVDVLVAPYTEAVDELRRIAEWCESHGEALGREPKPTLEECERSRQWAFTVIAAMGERARAAIAKAEGPTMEQGDGE